MPPLPKAIILALAPFAPPFPQRVWRHAHVLLVGAILAPGTRTVAAALRAKSLAAERHFANYHRVVKRCTELEATPEQILQWLVMRWSVEVTFEESRALLGLETQPQWSDLAIARTTPILVGPVFIGHRVGLAAEPRQGNPSAGDGLESQRRADFRRLSYLGAWPSLACPVFGELCSCGRDHAISA
jgi:hypothetical protein